MGILGPLTFYIYQGLFCRKLEPYSLTWQLHNQNQARVSPIRLVKFETIFGMSVAQPRVNPLVSIILAFVVSRYGLSLIFILNLYVQTSTKDLDR